jgi:hypothetical protein
VVAAAIVLLVAGARPVRASSIGVDGRSGIDYENLSTGVDFDQFRDVVQAAGTLVPVTTFDTATLAGLDALILRQPAYPRDAFTPAQLDAIHQFVAAGGGLIQFGEGGFETGSTLANYNQLAAPYGGQFGTDILGGDGVTMGGFLPHAVTAGVTSIGLDYYRPLSSINPPGVDLTVGNGSQNVLMVVNGKSGAGNVVLFSDPSAFVNSGRADRTINFGDNRVLLENMIRFALVPEPSGFLTLLPLAGHLLRRRRRV